MLLTVADEVLSEVLLVVAVDQVVGMLARAHRVLAEVVGRRPLTIHDDKIT